MKKLSLVLIIILPLLVHSQGIKFGVKAGINYANYTNAEVKADAITNFHAGLITEIKIFKNFAFQPELLYSTQGAKVTNLGTQIKNELGYISIPVLAKFFLTDNFCLELGPQASFLLSERNDFTIGDTNTFDFAVAGGLSFNLTKNLFIQGRYGLGLTEPKRDADVKNSVVQGSIGFMF